MDWVLKQSFNHFLSSFCQPLPNDGVQLSFVDGLVLKDVEIRPEAINSILAQNDTEMRVVNGRIDALRLGYVATPGVVQLDLKGVHLTLQPNAMKTIGTLIKSKIADIIDPPAEPLCDLPIQEHTCVIPPGGGAYPRQPNMKYIHRNPRCYLNTGQDDCLVAMPPPAAAARIRHTCTSREQYSPVASREQYGFPMALPPGAASGEGYRCKQHEARNHSRSPPAYFPMDSAQQQRRPGHQAPHHQHAHEGFHLPYRGSAERPALHDSPPPHQSSNSNGSRRHEHRRRKPPSVLYREARASEGMSVYSRETQSHTIPPHEQLNEQLNETPSRAHPVRVIRSSGRGPGGAPEQWRYGDPPGQPSPTHQRDQGDRLPRVQTYPGPGASVWYQQGGEWYAGFPN